MKRDTARHVVLIVGLLIAGGLCGSGARLWIGGLNAQHAQLERCVLSSRQSHATEDAGYKLAHLDVEVPACMDAAGYEQALHNQSCGPALWQGNVFCYLPKSSLGKLVYRIEASSAAKKAQRKSRPESSPSEG